MEPETKHDHAETRERLLEAASRLFAERGYAATSVRDITNEAASNVAAVNYHFGGKEKLYLEAFRSLLKELRDRRISAMHRDMEANPEMELEGFIESFARAFMEPLVDSSRGQLFMGFFAREMLDRRLPPEIFAHEFIRPLMEISAEGLNRYAPPLEPGVQRLCLMSIVGQLVHAFKAREHILLGRAAAEMVPTDIDAHIQHIVRFSVGGINACAGNVEVLQ